MRGWPENKMAATIDSNANISPSGEFYTSEDT